MGDVNLVSVDNNDGNSINLGITVYKNESDVSFLQPKGETGDTGAKGDKGEKGDKGDTGFSSMVNCAFTGNINGVNKTFVLNDNFDDIIAYQNGLKVNSSDYIYTKSNATVVFSEAVPLGYTLEFNGLINTDAQTTFSEIAFSGKLSEAINDGNFISDSDYVHTDNNFTDELQSELESVIYQTHTHSNKVVLDSIISSGDGTKYLSNDGTYKLVQGVQGGVKSVNTKTGDVNLTTADISDSTNKRYVSDASLAVLNNTSGINTGDETASTIKSKLGIMTLSGNNTGDQDLSSYATTTYVNTATTAVNSALTTEVANRTGADNALSSTISTLATSTQNSLATKVDTTTYSTYTTSTTSTLNTLSTQAHTHSNKTVLDSVIGTNTGDETTASIKSKLGITTLSGSNTGDQDLSGKVDKTTTVNGHALTNNITVTATDAGAPTLSSGNGVPSSTPAKVGDIYVDTTNYKTYISKGSSSSADWIKQNGSYALQASQSVGISPANATAYFFGALNTNFNSLNTSAGAAGRLNFPRAGTVNYVSICIACGVVGTSETSSLYLRINNTTDYLISSSVVANGFNNLFQNTALGVTVSAGDYAHFKWVTPTWATKPTSVSASAQILVDL